MALPRQHPVRRHAVASFFVLTFAVSWTGALLVALPHLMRHGTLPKLTGILMFPAMLLGPFCIGLLLTGLQEGQTGLSSLLAGTMRLNFRARWFAVLLIPPLLILGVLFALQRMISPAFTPNFFPLGMLFGIPAGLLEEIGWTGFAFPRIVYGRNVLASSIVLGLLWSFWHLPVVNYLGAATPHGSYWPAYFLAFALAMVAVRVLICWLYTNTRSVLLAQLMHISSTGSLVVFSAERATAAQEAQWYAVYGALLWLTVFVVVTVSGTHLKRNSR